MSRNEEAQMTKKSRKTGEDEEAMGFGGKMGSKKRKRAVRKTTDHQLLPLLLLLRILTATKAR